MANVIQGSPADDNLMGTSVADYISGGDGRDTILGLDGNDTLRGDAGNDLLDGGSGFDTYLFARGDGHDVVMAGIPGSPGQPDQLGFGPGINLADVDVVMQDGGLLLVLKGSNDSVFVPDYFNAAEPDRLLIRFIDGSALDAPAINRKLNPTDDNLVGTPAAEVLDGGLGHDHLMGQEGNDLLYGDAGNDWMDGGAGADVYLFGYGDGHDSVMAMGPDSVGDQIVLASGINVTDVSLQAEGPDLIVSLQGSADSIRLMGYFNAAEPDRPALRFGGGAIWDGALVQRKVFGSGVNIGGSSANDFLEGGAGRDTIFGSDGDDTLYGDGGSDILVGGLGSDTYLFGRGDGQDLVALDFGASGASPDILQLGAGITMADVVFGLSGSDLLLNLKSGGDSVYVAGYMNAPESERLVVRFAGGAALDGQAISQALQSNGMFVGGSPTGPHTLIGSQGDDVLIGTNGDDILYGGQGRDFMDGGQGSDVYLFGRGDGQDMIVNSDPGAPGMPDRLRFASGINMADVDVYNDNGLLTLRIKGSDDMVSIGNYFNMAPQTRMLIQFADGSFWDAQAIDRKLSGTLYLAYGTPGNDVLDGGAGDDVVAGMDGDDLLYGDTGNDRLFGGMGQDTYLFGRGDGQDMVQGSSAELSGDQLVFAGNVNVTDVDVRAEGGDLLLHIQGSTDAVRVTGYFNSNVEDRPIIRFASGAAWDAGIIASKLDPWSQGIYPKIGSHFFEGGLGNDQVMGSPDNDTLYGDGGRDFMDGGPGVDTYLFGRGDGQDSVYAGYIDHYGPFPQSDGLLFGANISIADISVKQVNSTDLLVSVNGTSDSVLLLGYFNLAEPERMRIQFADGSSCDALAINRKLNATPDFIGAQPGGKTLDGGLGNDNIQGTQGDDILYGDAGRDMLIGGPGVDTYWFGLGDGQDSIGDGRYGNERLTDSLRFGYGINLADVNASMQANDLLLSLPGGTDSVQVMGYFNQYDTDRIRIQFADGAGLDGQSVNRMINASDDQLYGTDSPDQLNGGLGNDSLYGQDGDDVLYGDAGNDWLDGGRGSDTYFFGHGDGVDSFVVDGSGGGSDLDQLVLGSGITAADITVARDSMNGRDLQLIFNGSNDHVQLVGYFTGLWSSQCIVRFADGMVWDYAAIDRKLNDYYPGDNFYGSEADDVYDGGNGDDTIYGQGGNDVLYGGAGNDLLDGGNGADAYLFGRGDGRDVVIADTNAQPDGPTDVLRLGAGISVSDVSVSAQGGDLLLNVAGGVDQVRVQNYFMANAQASMRIQFADGFSWDGAAINRQLYATDDKLIGTPDRDVLEGGMGNDTLLGLDENDMLSGSGGQDLLDGGAGVDTMMGGLGNDTYVVDNLADVVIEQASQGKDVIKSSVSFNVPDNVETIVLTGTDNVNATGSAIAGTGLIGNNGNNALTGGAGRDTLSGLFGADTLTGGGDSDVYYLIDEGDTIVESAQDDGLDLIIQLTDYAVMADNVEYLFMKGDFGYSAKGNAQENWLYGNGNGCVLDGRGGDDHIFGKEGADRLMGGLGNDELNGGLGNDTYVFIAGDGKDAIRDVDANAGNADTLVWQGINANQVWLAKSGNDLVISAIGTTDSVTVTGWFLGAAYHVESIVAGGNGKTLSDAKVQGLVNAMSTFAPPPLGQTTLTPAYSNALGNVIASSWS